MNGVQSNSSAPSATPPDPFKRVKYSLGMVLGDDDFNQEFAYLSHRDQWLARDLIGYGTVCGLQVTIAVDSDGPRVQVSAGVAVTPRGHLVRVTPDQCAYLNAWLAAHADEVTRHLGSPSGGTIRLAVVLCHRDCPTDNVPIPGEPCRTEKEATVASRLKDDFRLELSFDAPNQREEDALRDFVAWLSQIEITDAPTSISLAEFLDALRNATFVLQSPPAPPPSPPDFLYGSPPSTWTIHSADACSYLREAFRVWVTELRPLWRGPSCSGIQPDEECVLLAEIDVPIAFGNQAGPMTAANVHEERRPFLIHLRMLQEWLLCGQRSVGGGSAVSPAAGVVAETTFGQAASVGTLIDQFALADHTHGSPALPPGAQPGDSVISETVFGQAASAGVAAQFSRLDHTHGTPALPPIPQPGDTVVAETNFGLTPNPGTSLVYSRADHTHGSPSGSPATGDFVQHPAGLPPYFIVAAGIAQADSSDPTPAWAPNYNDLAAGVIAPSQVLIRFKGYAMPKGEHQYIVKALPVFDSAAWEKANVAQPIVNFQNYHDDGIVLFVTNLGQPIEPKSLILLSFVIEISRYQGKLLQNPRRLIDLNTATVDELRTLPRIGPALAERIVAARKKAKGFKSLQDLENVPGIGAELISHIEPFVTVRPQ